MKKNVLLIILMFFIASNLYSQEEVTLLPVNKLVKSKTSIASLYYGLGSDKTHTYYLNPNKIDEIILRDKAYQTVLRNDSLVLIDNKLDPFNSLFTKNKEQITRALSETSFNGSMFTNELVTFNIKNEKDTCISIGSFIYDKVFNTLKTDERQRAKTVINEVVLPASYSMYESLKGTNFKSLIIVCAYGKKDFSDRYLSEKGCSIACSIDLDILGEVLDLEISEDEIFKHIDVYLHDESEVKKISL